MARSVPSAKEIVWYLHCRKCLSEVVSGDTDTGTPESPQSYSQLDVGFTPFGIQVWCRRHDINVINIDFEGQQHPANMNNTKAI